MHRILFVAVMLLLAACASPPAAPPTDILLLGEQHDAPGHQRLHGQAIQALVSQGRLAAVALEMAEQGTSTAGLSRDASDAAVRAALRWDDSAWPWQAYGPAVMAAVVAGVPVVGANLPRLRMRAAMADAALDALLPGPALKAQQQAIRLGHCELLPETQIAPMTRVQIARDQAMAQTLSQAAVAGKTVVLLAGAAHVDPKLGVPQHLPASLRVDARVHAPQPVKKDYCDELRRQMIRRAS
jgi:uncharacterized iron-regulated protein